MSKSLSQRKHSVYQKIKRRGLYFRPFGGWYWAPWMKNYKGCLVYAISSLFSVDRIHIYDTETNQYLGDAVLKIRSLLLESFSPVSAGPCQSISVH